MTSPRLRAPHWAFVLGFAGVVSIPPTGAAQAQFFDPFSQFFAPQAPTYAPQAPVYAPPVVYRRTPRVSRRTQPVLTSVPDRPHVRRSRVPERVPRQRAAPNARPHTPREPARPRPLFRSTSRANLRLRGRAFVRRARPSWSPVSRLETLLLP